MKAKEVREMADQELVEKLRALKEELFNLRYQANTGRLEKHGQVRKVKKDIARINTIFRERQLINAQAAK
ncbi:MAG: 50S ribosomal protein L29 [Candidatus Omnitrophica bacterium]|nr:50S ribosomal protein L29 [Candidatus Omnitrophota bacterium]